MPLPPGFVEDTPMASPQAVGGTPPKGFIEDSTNPDFGQVVKDALNEAHFGNGSKLRDLMTDPITQAKALPYLIGFAGTLLGGPTAAYVMGRGLSDAALSSYGRPEEIPPISQQAGELAGSVVSEAIPAMGRYMAGKDIGKVEAAIPGLSNIKKVAPPSSMTTATKLMQRLKGAPLSVEEAKAAQPAVKSVWGSPWVNQQRYSSYLPDFTEATQNVSDTLNTIPGREEAAARMARLNTIPNYVGKALKIVPRSLKFGMGIGAGEGMTDALAKAIFNIGLGR